MQTLSVSLPSLRRVAPLLVMVGLALVLFLLPHIAEASPAAGGGLPWESPLQKISDSFSGPVAFAISLIGIIVCGAMLIWGGEINEFARRAIMLVLVIALLVFANSVLSSLFNKGATLIAPAQPIAAHVVPATPASAPAMVAPVRAGA